MSNSAGRPMDGPHGGTHETARALPKSGATVTAFTLTTRIVHIFPVLDYSLGLGSPGYRTQTLSPAEKEDVTAITSTRGPRRWAAGTARTAYVLKQPRDNPKSVRPSLSSLTPLRSRP